MKQFIQNRLMELGTAVYVTLHLFLFTLIITMCMFAVGLLVDALI